MAELVSILSLHGVRPLLLAYVGLKHDLPCASVAVLRECLDCRIEPVLIIDTNKQLAKTYASTLRSLETKLERPSVRPTSHPSNRESVRPTVRPVLLRRKTNIVLTATTSTLFIATTKETTKEVPRPKAAAPLLWWRPKAATFVVAMNRVDVVAADTIFVLRLSKSGRTVGRTSSRLEIVALPLFTSESAFSSSYVNLHSEQASRDILK